MIDAREKSCCACNGTPCLYHARYFGYIEERWREWVRAGKRDEDLRRYEPRSLESQSPRFPGDRLLGMLRTVYLAKSVDGDWKPGDALPFRIFEPDQSNYMALYFQENHDRINRRRREYMKSYRDERRELVNRQAREYYALNRERIQERRRRHV